jgi:hypothetical protein
MPDFRRFAWPLVGAFLLGGCYSGHPADDGAIGTVDGARASDAGPPDEGVEGSDAGCTPQLHVTAACNATWARAFGADDYGVYPDALAMTNEGAWLLQFITPSGAQLDVDGERFGWGGDPILLALAPDGSLRWGRDRDLRGLFGAHDDVVAIERQDWDEVSMSWRASLEHANALDGATLTQWPAAPGSRWIAVVGGACPSGCASREVRVLTWEGSIDLGALGSRTGAYGTSVVLFEDDVPLWDWTRSDDTPFDLRVIAPDSALAIDGTLTLALVDFTDTSVCLEGLPCLERWQSAVVRFAVDGTVADVFVVPDVVRSVSRLGDDLIVSANHSLARHSASGDVRWTNDRLGSWVGSFALDRTSGYLRGEIGVPHEPLELAGEVVHDCVEAYPWSPTHTVLVTVDPSTGDVVSLDALLEGSVRALVAHPAGGLALAQFARGRAPTASICGRTLMRDDAPGGPIDAVIAHVE